MEIEKKYLVAALPDDLERYEKWEIEQGYLCREPVLRIRRKNEDYILTYKSRGAVGSQPGGPAKVNVNNEAEFPLTETAYRHLRQKADGKLITKTRYRLPYGKYIIELDVFHGEREGFLLAEVEFDTVEESRSFSPPPWFGEDVSGDERYTNSYLASH